MGGTFDILHKGHRALLTKASEIGNKVLIGLTTDKRARKWRPEVKINSYETRKNNLEILLDSMKHLKRENSELKEIVNILK